MTAQVYQEIERAAPTNGAIPHAGQQLVLDGVGWQTYTRLRRLLAERRLRITYDNGVLEIMTLSPEHERYKLLLGVLIFVLAEELKIRLMSFGSMTFQRRSIGRGLEPDQCYWVHNAAQVRGKVKIDLRRDPPPDLVVEIDITSSSVDRMKIYASLGVSEVWRYNGKRLHIDRLNASGEYVASPTSPAFPFLSAAELERLIEFGKASSDTEMSSEFRAWIQAHKDEAHA